MSEEIHEQPQLHLPGSVYPQGWLSSSGMSFRGLAIIC